MKKELDRSCIFSTMQESRMCQGLNEDQIRQLGDEKKVRLEHFKKNDILFWTDKTPEYIYMLVEGNLAMARDTMGGTRVLSQSITKKGEITGDIRLFLEKKNFWEYAVAMQDSDVIRINSSVLLGGDSVDPVIQSILLRNLLSNAVDRIEKLGKKYNIFQLLL